jgi:phosphomannomutase
MVLELTLEVHGRELVTEVIKFGTDGWRDIIADGFTFENVARAAQAHAQHLKRSGGQAVVVGFDTRFHSERFARVAAEVMAANGLKTFLAKSFTPTPALSFAVKHYGAAGGVMITASHNPPSYNGYKMKGPYGGSSTPEIVGLVESELVRLEDIPVFDSGRHVIELFDIRADYFAALERNLNMDALRAYHGLLYHDAMGGAGAGWLEAFVKRFKLPLEVRSIRGAPNPMFYGVNPEPIPQNLESPMAVMTAERDERAFCAVTDGDADRIGAVLAGGAYFNSHQIFCVLLKHLHAKGLRGRVVKTVSGTQIIDRLAAWLGLELLETPVGFKYITDAFLEGESDPGKVVLMGGEESGGMASLGHIPERDGLFNALLMLEAVAVSGKSLGALFAEIESEVGVRHAYDRLDLHLGASVDKVELMRRLRDGGVVAGRGVLEVNARDGVKWLLEGDAWLMFRASGTEPVVRVYAEAPSLAEVRLILEAGRKLVLA